MNLDFGVRFFNAAAINQPINIFINDRLVINRLDYRNAGDYIPLTRGKYNIKIYAANSGELLYNQTINVNGNRFITLSIISEAGKADLIVLEDYLANNRDGDIIKQITDGFSGVVSVMVNRAGEIIEDVKDQFGNIFVSAGDKIKRIIDVFGNETEVVINKFGSIAAVVAEEFTQFTGEFLELIGSSVTKIADQFGNLVDVVIDQFDNIVAWVIGEISDSRGNRQNNAYVRVVHLSQNTGAVDTVLPDTTKLFVDTKYKQTTDYTPVGVDTRLIRIRNNNTNQIILTLANLNFVPGRLYTIYIIGLQNAAPPLDALVLPDGF